MPGAQIYPSQLGQGWGSSAGGVTGGMPPNRSLSNPFMSSVAVRAMLTVLVGSSSHFTGSCLMR